MSLVDLMIGACAHRHGAVVLHVDRHFDLISEVFGFESTRLPVWSDAVARPPR